MNTLYLIRPICFPRPSVFVFLGSLAFIALPHISAAEEVIDIGSRRQLFLGDHLIGKLKGVRQELHSPVRRDIAIKPEHPWEKHGVSYMVAFRDQGKFRAWYRVDGSALDQKKRHSMTAYAESDNGIHWTKPKLGIIEFNGSRENNLVWDGSVENLAVFRDDNPNCHPSERYKALARSRYLHGLVSPDGWHWKRLERDPLSTERPFDSHNIGFWDRVTGQYVAYTRGVRRNGRLGQGMTNKFKQNGVRWVRRATSQDFRHWTPLQPIQTAGAPREELYTNSTIRYDRAPDFLLMFPSRYASGRKPDPDWKYIGVNDIAFLSSRDGIHFERTFMEAFIRPGLDQGNWHDRSLYMERGLLDTSPTELSLYCMQNWRLPTCHIRRYTLRKDGFVSLRGSYEGGEFITKPLKFVGSQLRLNVSTSAVGSVRVEIQQADGKVIPGYELSNCPDLYVDKLDVPVSWKQGTDVSRLAEKTIRLRFELKDADLYALRFVNP